ncbi:jg9042 [Pararge aegeria aegeria]|uniref:Jg9042 protein n=1 Tax=Pararge aegeria aegeria TaxID=348720 RepID=A0A8S4RAR5_9NEOP|nr:jg9042 [Pararge aegeria aegeria]
MSSSKAVLKRQQLPKLMACMTKNSLENLRNRALFSLETLDAKGIRRRKLPLHECLILELRESGYSESSDYLQDLIYDNIQLLAEDDIGIVVDLRKREAFLEDISAGLMRAEKQRDKGKFSFLAVQRKND